MTSHSRHGVRFLPKANEPQTTRAAPGERGPSIFEGAAYVVSAHSLRDLPLPAMPEIAFAGRSNAGKSSALNALARHKRLAFTSKLPGRTQLINFFALRSGALLVDLPGYGYAKVPAAVREHWGTVVAGYLSARTSLCGLVLIMDVRNPLTSLDEQLDLPYGQMAMATAETESTKAKKRRWSSG